MKWLCEHDCQIDVFERFVGTEDGYAYVYSLLMQFYVDGKLWSCGYHIKKDLIYRLQEFINEGIKAIENTFGSHTDKKDR